MQQFVNNFIQNIVVMVVLATPLFAQKPIVVLTTSYNNKVWAAKNIESILQQDYMNYRVVFVDDASTDGTADIVEKIAKNHPRKPIFNLIRNEKRKGALENIYYAIHKYCQDEEIVVSLDGDDWFYDDQVLKKIDETYSSAEVWLTHGTLIEFPSNKVFWSIPIPENIIQANTFRTYRCPSHLRTFYAWLFKKIKIEDLQYQAKFFEMAWDQAMMFPMSEMAGIRQAFISDILYVYNMQNPLNDNKVDPQLQNDLEAHIRSMSPYKPLEKAPMGIQLCQVDDRNFQAIQYVGTRPTGGAVQLQLLQMEGLQKSDYVLEIGSGALMAGIPIMSFLEKGHYCGIEPNSWLIRQSLAIEANRTIVADRKPTFLNTEDFNAESTGMCFDYVFAHSIMSHAAHSQLSLFFKNTAQVLKKGGKVIFSLRLTKPNKYGNEGAEQETEAEEWQYPGCSFFSEETVIREAKKWFCRVEYKENFTAAVTADNPYACHDWFVLTK